MIEDSRTEQRLAIVREYFAKVGQGDPSLADLFADNFQFHFPKFGLGEGKDALAEFANRMGRKLASIGHDIERFRYIVSGDAIVVEGTEYGKMHDGSVWPDHQISEGRFCSVFEFDGPLISRMFIYVDPDFCSEDRGRVSWLREPSGQNL